MSIVSIITPIFNAEKFIKKTIDSIINQTYQHWELILVDDGSTDQSFQAIQPYLKDPRIKYRYQENQGQGKARNTGIQNSVGDLIAFLDADDLWIPEKLALQVDILNNPNIDLTYSNAFIINSVGVCTGRVMASGAMPGILTGNNLLIKLIKGNIFIPILTVLLKREVITKLGNFDESVEIKNAEDFDLWIRMASQGSKFFFDDNCLSYYRIHEHQSTAKDPTSTGQVIRSMLNLRRNHPTLSKEINLSILDRLILLFRKSKFLIYKKDNFYHSLCEIGTSTKYLNRIIVYYLPPALPFYCWCLAKMNSSRSNDTVQQLKNI